MRNISVVETKSLTVLSEQLMLCLSLPQWQFEAHKMLLDYLDFRAQFKRMDLGGFIFARVYFLDACLHCTIVAVIWSCWGKV